jgi:cell division protein FtsL
VTQQINLFNPIFLRQKKYFSFITILQGLALLLVGVLGFYAYATYHMGQLNEEVQDVNKRLEQEKSRLSKAGKEFGPRQKSKELEMQVKDLEKQVREREEILGIQAGAEGRGFSEYLRAFARQSVNGLWLTSFSLSEGGSKMVIGGRALRADLVPDYLRRLGNEKIMHGQPFSSLDMKLTRVEKVGGYFEFNLYSVEPQAPGDDPAKAAR